MLSAPLLRSEEAGPDSSTPAQQAQAESPRRRTATMEELAAALTKEREQNAPVTSAITLPPLPEGVTELKFNEFYRMPIGPRGLEPTEKLLSLHGKRVRILGFMGNIRLRNNRQMIFAPVPLKAQPLEYGMADDVPAAHILAKVPGNPAEPLPYTPGPMLLTGVLSVGAKSFDGENAFVRLLVDVPAKAPAPPAAASAPQQAASPTR